MGQKGLSPFRTSLISKVVWSANYGISKRNKLIYFLVVGGCPLEPCLNGGTCIPHLAQSYICRCPEGYTGVNCGEFIFQQFGFNYVIIHTLMNWHEAGNKCENRGYTLASITTIEELTFMAENLSEVHIICMFLSMYMYM